MLFTRSFGKPDSQPLIFLHGFLGSSLDFLPLIEELQKKYFCLAIDLPAHGNSSYQQNTLLAVQKTVESLAFNPILLGYSLGGRIALYLSQKTSLSLKATLVLSSHIGLNCEEQKKRRLTQDLLWAQKLKTLSSVDFLTAWYKQDAFSSLQKHPQLLKSLLQKRLFNNPEELALVLEEMSLAHQPLLNIFSSPTFFFYGEEDVKCKKLYQTLSPPRLEIKNAGHILHLENPQGCIKAIHALNL